MDNFLLGVALAALLLLFVFLMARIHDGWMVRRFMRVVFYGPYRCDCGAMICRGAIEDGAPTYNYPAGPIYPNVNWTRHHHN